MEDVFYLFDAIEVKSLYNRLVFTTYHAEVSQRQNFVQERKRKPMRNRYTSHLIKLQASEFKYYSFALINTT